MKKTFVLLFSISLLWSTAGFAETYNCAYTFNGEAFPFSLKRQGNGFNKSIGVYDEIIFDDQNAIVLSKTYTFDSPQTYTTLINKENLNFVFVGLEYKNNTEIIEGPCSLVK